jgi:CheY-like chemotaxis protein
MDNDSLKAAMGRLRFHAFQNRVRIARETAKRAEFQFREARALLNSSDAEQAARNELEVIIDCLKRLSAEVPRAKVLVVDDERAIATSLVSILEGAGYRAVSAFDGEEAVTTAQQFKPDCLVTDVVMPGRNGIETAISILKSVPHCKVLLISGQQSASELLRNQRGELRAELLPKPITPQELLGHVAALLRTEIGHKGQTAGAA